ncbi:MAG: GNAT family N-acetyltransferase [Clostridiales bacterium]|nr:GNAT family N-acetyltransferase [Clostridiales bacterium]
MIDYAVEKIKDMGYNEIFIGADKDNSAALHLYRKKALQILFLTALMSTANIINY